VMRMLAQTPPIENGMVLLPNHAHWLADYVQELITFPKAKYDDQVDSTAQALKWMSQGAGNDAYILGLELILARDSGMTVDAFRELQRQRRGG
jgi:hypothetical protein